MLDEMIANRTATVTIECADKHMKTPALPGAEVEAAIAGLERERDVTLVIELDGADERLMIAVDGSVAFLGLERADGLFQFAIQSKPSGRRELLIGGQPTSLDARYLVDLKIASLIAREWVERGEDSSYGSWERQ